MKPDLHQVPSGSPDSQGHQDPAEPAVRSPELARLVALAREQPLPPLRSDAARLHAGFLAARQQQTRRRVAIGGLALAAGLTALVLTRVDLGLSRQAGPNGHVAQDMSQAPGQHGVAAPRAPALATGVRVAAHAAAPSPTVLGPWDIELAPGSYRLEVDAHPGPELLRARSPGGTLELQHGRVEIVVGASETHARLQEGVATWIAPDQQRSPLMITSQPADAADSDTAPETADVRALARRAEAFITAGKRDEAITVLTQIVTRFADEPAARSALLDLAPLLKAAGRVDEARCAYHLYLGRYPGKAQLADDVRKALGRLGDGPTCDSLTPR